MILGESPIIEGTWFNPKTGHSFKAKDTYIEDNKMYVVTTEGQRIDYDMLSQYVKSDNPDKDMKMFSKPQPAADVLPPEVREAIIPVDTDDSLMTDEDKALIYGGSTVKNNILEKPVQNNLGNIHQPEDEDTLLVRRMLKKSENPTIDCKISWKGFPLKQMDMLDTMGVDYEKIADFYMKDLDIKDIQAVIKCAIISEIEKHLKDSPITTVKEQKAELKPEKPFELAVGDKKDGKKLKEIRNKTTKRKK